MRVQRAHRQAHHFFARQLGELRRRREAQRAVRRGHCALLADRLDDVAAEGFIGERVRHHADVRLLAHARHRERRERAQLVFVLFPAERERQEVQRVAHREEAQEPRQAPDVPDHVVVPASDDL